MARGLKQIREEPNMATPVTPAPLNPAQQAILDIQAIAQGVTAVAPGIGPEVGKIATDVQIATVLAPTAENFLQILIASFRGLFHIATSSAPAPAPTNQPPANPPA
jgi:hypothetical protein